MQIMESSVVRSLQMLAALEEQRVEDERAQLAEDARARARLREERAQAEQAQRRREELELVAARAAALERARLEHQAARERELETQRAAEEHLREADRLLASRETSSRLALLVRLAHGVATVSLALALGVFLQDLRNAHRAQIVASRDVAEANRTLSATRAENAELTRQNGVALDTARNAARSLSIVAPPRAPDPVSPPPVVVRHPNAPVAPIAPAPLNKGCDRHDPLCGDL